MEENDNGETSFQNLWQYSWGNLYPQVHVSISQRGQGSMELGMRIKKLESVPIKNTQDQTDSQVNSIKLSKNK